MRYPTLRETVEKLASEEACLTHLERIRWPDGPRCPKCTTPTDVSRFRAIGKTGKVRRLLDSSKMRISAKEVERMLGVSYETAWHMRGLIRPAMEKRSLKVFLRKLIGVVEVEES